MAREKKFTKGPWDIMNQGAIWLIYGPLGERICKMLYPDRPTIRKANASIISAAPELLEALETIEGLILNGIIMVSSGATAEECKTAVENLKAARVAITKAYGE